MNLNVSFLKKRIQTFPATPFWLSSCDSKCTCDSVCRFGWISGRRGGWRHTGEEEGAKSPGRHVSYRLLCCLVCCPWLVITHAQACQLADEISQAVKRRIGGPGLVVIEAERLDKIDSTNQ